LGRHCVDAFHSPDRSVLSGCRSRLAKYPRRMVCVEEIAQGSLAPRVSGPHAPVNLATLLGSQQEGVGVLLGE
jgi:hypothetical protein